MANFVQKVRLLQGLCNREKAFTGPFYAMIDLTRRCNLHCHGCKFHSPDAQATRDTSEITDFPYELVEDLLADLSGMGTRTLFLLADGEPLLYPRFFDVVGRAKHYRFHTTTTTNGTRIDRSMADGLVDSGIDSIHISLWASSPETYEQYYPGSGAQDFSRVLDGIKAVVAAKQKKRSRTPWVSLLNPTDKLNYRNVGRMFELARECGCDEIRFTPFKAHRGKYIRYALSEQEKDELRHLLLGLKGRIAAASMKDNIDGFLARNAFDRVRERMPCYACWFYSRIKVDGTVVPCGRSDVALGNLVTQRFADIWNGESYRRERRKLLAEHGRRYLDQVADCEACSYARDNMRVHRIIRRLRPFLRHYRNSD